MNNIFSPRALSGLLASILVSTGAQAAVTITAVENAGDVIFTLESGGSLDTSGMLFGFSFDTAIDGAINPSTNAIQFAPAGEYTIYQGISGSAFGSGGFSAADSYTGDLGPFGFGGDELYLADGYNSGDLLSEGSISFTGETFASLGIDAGVYVYTLLGSNDTITLNVVPIPAAAWLFASALAGLGWVRRKQSSKTA